MNSQALKVLERGTQVTLRYAEDKSNVRWWKVDADGTRGWLPEKVLGAAPLEGSPAAAAIRLNVAYAALPQSLMLAPPPQGEDRRGELRAAWQAIRAGSIDERARACQGFPYSGHTDPAFFDLLEQWLKLRYEEALREEQKVDVDVTRCLQALASSGNTKYLGTLQTWARSPRHLINKYTRRYLVSKAPGFVADSALWNPIINDSTEQVAGHSWATTRVINMVRSDSLGLQREGMRRLKKYPQQHAAAFDALEARLLKEDPATIDSSRWDSIAWQCKTLAESRDPKYAATLTQVVEAGNDKVKRHCARALDELDDPPSDLVDADDDAAAGLDRE